MESVTGRLSDSTLLAEEATINPLSPLPSFLELILSDSTATSLQTALTSTLNTLIATLSETASNSSSSRFKIKLCRAFERLLNTYAAEIRTAIRYWLETKCLSSKSSALVSESVYGMMRAKVTPTTSTTPDDDGSVIATSVQTIGPLSDADRTRSAFLAALAPYVKQKLDAAYERLKRRRALEGEEHHNYGRMTTDTPHTVLRRNGNVSEMQRTSLKSKLQKWFLAAYPFLHMTHEGTILAYQWAYLLGRTVYYSPSLHVLGLILRRTTLADLNQQQTKPPQNHTPRPPKTSPQTPTILSNPISPKLQTYLKILRITLLTTLTTILLSGYISNLRNRVRRRRRLTQNDEELIPPPLPPVETEASAACPICHQLRVNPAVSTSGYVFCYRCLVLHVRECEKCPVTGVPCSEETIVRIYETVRQ